MPSFGASPGGMRSAPNAHELPEGHNTCAVPATKLVAMARAPYEVLSDWMQDYGGKLRNHACLDTGTGRRPRSSPI